MAKIFNGTRQANKRAAASYALMLVQKTQKAELVFNEDTGADADMSVGIRADGLGLIHVTCGSSTDPNARIWGFDPDHLAIREHINHVAFVWASRDSKVRIAIIAKETVIALGKQNGGNYSKAELLASVIPNGSAVIELP